MEKILGGTSLSIPKLAASVLFCLVIGSSGSFVTTTGPGSWYDSLNKPFFTPPGWIFAPVWITLFMLMGISLYLIWESGLERSDVRTALFVFGIQFALNVSWSFLFFGIRSPFLGFVDIILLWFMIIATIVLFFRIRKSAAYCLIPYFAWVSIAAILNGSILFLNL